MRTAAIETATRMTMVWSMMCLRWAVLRTGCSGSAILRLVAKHHQPGIELPGLRQSYVQPALQSSQHRLACTQEDRTEEKPVLIDQSGSGQADCQVGAAEYRHVLAGLALQLGYFFDGIVPDQSRVLPFSLFQRPGEDDFGQIVHLPGDDRIVGLGRKSGPVTGHELIGHAPE